MGFRKPLQLGCRALKVAGLRGRIQHRPGRLQLRDGPLKVERGGHLGREILPGLEAIDLREGVVVQTMLAQSVNELDIQRRRPRGQSDPRE